MTVNQPGARPASPSYGVALERPYETSDRAGISYLDMPLIASDAFRAMYDSEAEADGLLEMWRESFLEKQEEVLAFPSDNEGIDEASVETFMLSLGMTTKRHRLLSPDDFELAIEASGEPCAFDARSLGGIYLGDLDVVLVCRRPGLEAYNRAKIYEVFLAHEQGHGFCSTVVSATDGESIIESGYYYQGEFLRTLEEGWACLIQGLYVCQVLGGSLLSAQYGRGQYGRLEKYMWVDDIDGEVCFVLADGARVAVIIEQLIERDPTIFTLLYEARMEPSKIYEIEHYLNSRYDGLFDKLRGIEIYTGEGQQELQRLNQCLDDQIPISD